MHEIRKGIELKGGIPLFRMLAGYAVSCVGHSSPEIAARHIFHGEQVGPASPVFPKQRADHGIVHYDNT